MTISPEKLRHLSELAISEGQQLLQYSSRLLAESQYFPLKLEPHQEFSGERALGFFGHIEIDGQARSAMGCRHRILVNPNPGPKCAEELRDFAFKSLLKESAITDQNRLGGFTVRRVLSAHRNGPDVLEDTPVDWRLLSDNMRWTTVSIELHDFELRLGPLRQRPRQIVLVVQHPAFVSDQSNPSLQVVHKVMVGYPFVQHTPLRNPFGFGPGKFGAAIKLFIFSLRTDESLEIEMIFIAAPRCEKVLDVFGLPDPVYGVLGIIEVLTLGAVQAQPRRDRLEAIMLETHCRVHAALLAGFVRRWRGAQNAVNSAEGEPNTNGGGGN